MSMPERPPLPDPFSPRARRAMAAGAGIVVLAGIYLGGRLLALGVVLMSYLATAITLVVCYFGLFQALRAMRLVTLRSALAVATVVAVLMLAMAHWKAYVEVRSELADWAREETPAWLGAGVPTASPDDLADAVIAHYVGGDGHGFAPYIRLRSDWSVTALDRMSITEKSAGARVMSWIFWPLHALLVLGVCGLAAHAAVSSWQPEGEREMPEDAPA